MEELEKNSKSVTVREYLNTLDTEEFAQVLILSLSHLECIYMDTELDVHDVNIGIEFDIIDWLDSPYCEDKKLLPSVKLSIYDDDEENEYLDD